LRFSTSKFVAKKRRKGGGDDKKKKKKKMKGGGKKKKKGEGGCVPFPIFFWPEGEKEKEKERKGRGGKEGGKKRPLLLQSSLPVCFWGKKKGGKKEKGLKVERGEGGGRKVW